MRRDGHYNRTPHGGVALYVHQDIAYTEVRLQTPLQAAAI